MKNLMLTLVLFIITFCNTFANTKDSTAVTYYKNGKKKVEKIFRKSAFRMLDTTFILSEIKEIKYYNDKGKKISKSNFESLNRKISWDEDDNWNLEDTETYDPEFDKLIEKMNAKKGKFYNNNLSLNILKLNLIDSLNSLPITIFLRLDNNKYWAANLLPNKPDSAIKYVSKSQDTIINGSKYSTQLFLKDGVKKTFIGAIKTNYYKIYFYDSASNKDNLVLDVGIVLEQIGDSVKESLGAFIDGMVKFTYSVSQAGKDISKEILPAFFNIILPSQFVR